MNADATGQYVGLSISKHDHAGRRGVRKRPMHSVERRWLVPMLLIWFCRSQAAAAADITVSGNLVYGHIDTSFESSTDCGERRSIYGRGLAEGLPIQFVTVQLVHQTTGIVAASTITDQDGNFSLGGISGTPNILRIKAENDYIFVKRSKLIPLSTDQVISVDFDISDKYEGGDVDIPDRDVSDTYDRFSNGWSGDLEPVSRALYICTSVHRAARHVETIAGISLCARGACPVQVRLGWGGTAWFDGGVTGLPGTVHLPTDEAVIMEHEYGHAIELAIGAFGDLPAYWGHQFCNDTNACWGFHEGLASWYAAVNSVGFASVSGVPFFGTPTDSNGNGHWDTGETLPALGYSWWIEYGPCLGSVSDCAYTGAGSPSDLREVEDVVAQVFWDLVDDHIDELDPIGSNVPEVAKIPIQDVLQVLMEDIGLTTPCTLITTIYTHPATLEQFCETYQDLLPADVYPDLYAGLTHRFGPRVVCGAGSWDRGHRPYAYTSLRA